MVFFIMIAGCIGTEEHNQTVPSTTASGYNQTPASTQTPTPTPNQPHPVSNETYWIHLDPVGNRSAGDIVVITGTTNLNISEEILVQVYPTAEEYKILTSMCADNLMDSGGSGTVTVVAGNQNDVHNFSWSLNSSHSLTGHVFKPLEYTAIAKAVMREAEDKRNFTLVPSNLSANITYVPSHSGCG
jgi:hypothetical protein